MVKIKKNMTHIYHDNIKMAQIDIGSSKSVNNKQITLFDKSLVLTSDLKRLPLLLGGKLMINSTGNFNLDMGASNLDGLELWGVLMNGSYDADDFTQPDDLINDEKARADILLMILGLCTIDTNKVLFQLSDSHWDFEGQKILYDAMTLLIFVEGNTNVSVANFDENNIELIMEIEIDWEPVSKAELEEFVLEHIYAKQGD